MTRKVPAIHIFLTSDEIDPKTPGFQKGTSSTFWRESSGNNDRRKNDEDYLNKNKSNRNNHNRFVKRTKPNGTSAGTSSSPSTSVKS